MPTYNQIKGKTIGYGFAIYLATMVFMFVISLFGSAEMNSENVKPGDLVVAFVGTAVLTLATAFLLGRSLKMTSRRDALLTGVTWLTINAALYLVIGLGNGTTNILFGHWAPYLMYLAIFLGPVLSFPAKTTGAIPPNLTPPPPTKTPHTNLNNNP